MPEEQQNQIPVQPIQGEQQYQNEQQYTQQYSNTQPNTQQYQPNNPVCPPCQPTQPVQVQQEPLPSAESIINTPLSQPAQPKIIQGVISQFLLGFAALWIVLWIHAYATLTQYFGMVSDVQTALYISLAMSIILLVITVLVSIGCVVIWKKPFIVVGAVIAIPVSYTVSSAIREGFAIFFEFI